jgi:hypothetical protein
MEEVSGVSERLEKKNTMAGVDVSIYNPVLNSTGKASDRFEMKERSRVSRFGNALSAMGNLWKTQEGEASQHYLPT